MSELIFFLQIAASFFSLTTLLFILIRLFINNRRPIGQTTGTPTTISRNPVFLVVATLLFVGINFLLWVPLPLILPQVVKVIFAIVGSAMLYSGLAGYLWGIIVLGNAFTAASSLGASVFKGQALVTRAPFSIVRHPMYLGLQCATFGGLVLFWNWSTVFLFVSFAFLFIRARKEELVLKATFGDEWINYCHRVPFWFPRLRKKN